VGCYALLHAARVGRRRRPGDEGGHVVPAPQPGRSGVVVQQQAARVGGRWLELDGRVATDGTEANTGATVALRLARGLAVANNDSASYLPQNSSSAYWS